MDSLDTPRPNVPARLPSPRPGSAMLRQVKPPEGSTSPLSLRVALRGARRYWWLVLLLWVVGSSAVGIGLYVKILPTFMSSSMLRVEAASGRILGIPTDDETLDPFLQTQVQLITSNNVLQAAASDPKVAALPRIRTAGDVPQELRKVLAVGVIQGTYLISVAMSSPDSRESALIVNAVVDAYLKANSEWTDGSTLAQIQNLEDYLLTLRKQGEDLEDRWREIVRRGGGESLFIQQDAAPGAGGAGQGDGKATKVLSATFEEFKQVHAATLDLELKVNEEEAMVRQLEYEAANPPKLRTNMDEDDINRIVARRFLAERDVIELAEQRNEAREKFLQVARITDRPDDPAVIKARQIREKLDRKYQQLWDNRSREYREEILAGGREVDRDRDLREARSRLSSLKIQLAALKEHAGRLKLQNLAQATDSVEIALIQDRRSNIRSIEETINRRVQQLKFEIKGQNRVRRVVAATPSAKPIADKRLTYMAITPVGVLGTVLCLVVLLEVRSGRVADPEHLSSRVQHEVFSIAPLPNLRPGEENDARAEQRLAKFVQSLDHLRVALCEHGVSGEGRCVMITSATGGEGKTTLAAHLAARCANAGTSTLLIDADLRRASLGRLLDVPIGAGLGDVLGGDADLDEALITVQAGGFHFLSAGTPGRDPSRVLKSSRFADLIGRLRRTYDLVIIDTPPVLPVADALIMGRWVDGAVMTARYDASRLPLVERANRQLAVAGIPILGVVVNGVRGTEGTYGNYTYTYNHYASRPNDAPTA